MRIRTLLILGTIAFFGWRYMHVDAAAERRKAGVAPDDVVMFSAPECGDLCAEQMRQLRTRSVHAVQLDVDSPLGAGLWKAFGSPNSFPIFLVRDQLVTFVDLRASLVAAYGDKALTRVENYFFKTHFDASQRPQAVLYTAVWCGYCKALRADLQSTATPFKEIDAERHSNAAQLAEIMGIAGFPAVYFGYQRLSGPPTELAQQIRQHLRDAK